MKVVSNSFIIVPNFQKDPSVGLTNMLNLIMAHAKYSKLNVNGDGLMTIKYLFTNRCNIHHYKWRISLTIRGKVLSNPALLIQRVLLLALRVRGKEFKVLYSSFFLCYLRGF